MPYKAFCGQCASSREFQGTIDCLKQPPLEPKARAEQQACWDTGKTLGTRSNRDQHCGLGSSLVPPWTEGNMKISSSLFLALLQNVPECKLEKHFCFHEKETIPTLGTVTGWVVSLQNLAHLPSELDPSVPRVCAPLDTEALNLAFTQNNQRQLTFGAYGQLAWKLKVWI